MKKLVILLAITLSLGLVLAQEENNKEVEVKYNPEKVELKYKPEKVEVKIPKIPEGKLGKEFQEIDDFVREKIAEHPSAEFFMLLPGKKGVGQGTVNSFDGSNLVLSSHGFQTTWVITTDTTIISSSRLDLLAQANPTVVTTSSLSIGQRVKVLGEWNGQNLIARRVISLAPRVTLTLEEVVRKLQEALQKANIQFDLTPLLQKLQQR